MAQKINPTSFRLGITKIWDSNFQMYGKSYSIYFYLLHQYLEINKWIRKILNFSGFSINFQNWEVGKSKIKLNIYYSKLVFKKVNLSIFKFISKILSIWLLKKAYITLYFKSQGSLCNNFLVNYVQHLLNSNIPSKKIIWNISKFLGFYLKNEKVIFYKNGILRVRLKGFKILLSGRLEDSKTQMAKNIEYSEGNLSLSTLKNYIIYNNNVVYTKYGTCGLKIWLFYEFC